MSWHFIMEFSKMVQADWNIFSVFDTTLLTFIFCFFLLFILTNAASFTPLTQKLRKMSDNFCRFLVLIFSILMLLYFYFFHLLVYRHCQQRYQHLLLRGREHFVKNTDIIEKQPSEKNKQLVLSQNLL